MADKRRLESVLAVLRQFGGIYGLTSKQVAEHIWLEDEDDWAVDGRSVTPSLIALERLGKAQRLREGRLCCWRARGRHVPPFTPLDEPDWPPETRTPPVAAPEE